MLTDKKMIRLQAGLTEATLPYTMASAVVPILKRLPEYQQARAEHRARRWLDERSMELGRDLAEVVWQHLDDIASDAVV